MCIFLRFISGIIFLARNINFLIRNYFYISINRGCYNLYIYNTSGPQVRWGEESVGSDGSCGQATQQLISLEEYSKVYLKLKEKYAQEFIKAIDWLTNSWYSHVIYL